MVIALLRCALVVVARSVASQARGKHHPTEKKVAKQGYTDDDLDKAIRAASAEKETTGIYQQKDGDKTWDLKLDKVHRERLSRIDESTYFACTDFMSSDSHTV